MDFANEKTGNVVEAAGAAYRDLAQLVRERGFMVKRQGLIMTQLAVGIAIHLGAIALFIAIPNIWVRIVALYLMTYGGLSIATNTHTSSHNASTRHSGFNKALTYFGYTFLFGTPANYWWNKHCVVHHPAPNVMEIDADADLMPFFAVNERDYQNSGRLAKAFYKIQWIFIVGMLAMNVFFTQLQGYRFTARVLADPKKRRTGNWIDVGVVILHYICFLAIPMYYFTPLSVIGFYALRNGMMGYAMFAGFGPAHFPDEAVFIDKKLLNEDYVFRQTATTVNFKTGFFGRLACCGVDYQIEHHLFPGVPHVYYPEMSKLIEEFCKQRGYPYRTLGWWESVWKSLVMFYRPKKVFDDAATLRAAEALQS
jgi:linoleoyl-CoA desaturase